MTPKDRIMDSKRLNYPCPHHAGILGGGVKMEMSDRLHAPTALLPGKNRGAYWIGGLVDSRASMDVLEQGKSLAPSGIRTPDRPIRS